MCDCGCEALNGIPEGDWEAAMMAANKIITERTMVSVHDGAANLQRLARRMNQIERGEP